MLRKTTPNRIITVTAVAKTSEILVEKCLKEKSQENNKKKENCWNSKKKKGKS